MPVVQWEIKDWITLSFWDSRIAKGRQIVLTESQMILYLCLFSSVPLLDVGNGTCISDTTNTQVLV